MAVAFPTASTVSLQAPDPSDPSGSMQAPGSGTGDPFAAMLASASIVPATAVGELPDAAGAVATLWTEAAITWPEPASDELPSEQLISLMAVPALPGLIDATVAGSIAAKNSPDLVSPDLVGPDLVGPDLVGPDLVSPDLISPDLVSPDLVSPDLAAALGAATPWPFQGIAALPTDGSASAFLAATTAWPQGALPEDLPPSLVLAAQTTWTYTVASVSASSPGAMPKASQGVAGQPPATLSGILPPAQANALPAAATPPLQSATIPATTPTAAAALPTMASPTGTTTPLSHGVANPLTTTPAASALPTLAEREPPATPPATGAPTPAPAQTVAGPSSPAVAQQPAWPAAAAATPPQVATTATPDAAATAPSMNLAMVTPNAGAALAAPSVNAATAIPSATIAEPSANAAQATPSTTMALVPSDSDTIPTVTAPASWLPPLPASARAGSMTPRLAHDLTSAASDDIPTDPLRALLLSVQRPIDNRRGAGMAATDTPAAVASAGADPAATGDEVPASSILGPIASADGDTPKPLPAWQRLADQGDQRPATSPPVGFDAPPPTSIPAAALQLRTDAGADARHPSAPAASSELNGLEALRTAPLAPLEPRPVAAETPVQRANPPTPVDRAIAGQITRQLVHTEANGDRTLVIRLTPAELGTVRIELREHNGTLTAHLRVEDEAVGRAIDRMLPSMRQELRGQDSPLADVVREPRDQRDQRGNGQPQDQSTPWSRQQERDSNRQGRRQPQDQAQAAFSLAGLVDGDAPLVPGVPAAELARPLR
jgi:hypothetical protein